MLVMDIFKSIRGNAKMLLLLLALAVVIAIASYHVGYAKKGEDVALEQNEELQKYIADNAKLQLLIDDLNDRQPEVVTKIVTEYISSTQETDKNVQDTIDGVNDGTYGLYGEAIRDAEARAATAELAAGAVASHAARSCKLSNQLTETFIREAGRADRIVHKVTGLQAYIRGAHDYIYDYKAIVLKFYQDNGYISREVLDELDSGVMIATEPGVSLDF